MQGRDRAAVLRAKAGDREAFREIVETHSRHVFGLAYRMTGNETDAEDVVQETFLRAYRGIGRFEGSSEVSTWLHRIAANCAVDLLRRRRGDPAALSARASAGHGMDGMDGMTEERPEDRLPDRGAGPEASAYGSEIERRMHASLGRLSPMERAAFTLRHFEGRSIADIASVLGVRAGAAKNCVFRAVAKLREDLAPLRAAR